MSDTPIYDSVVEDLGWPASPILYRLWVPEEAAAYYFREI